MTDRSQPGLSVDCADLVELVTDYLEGTLDEATRAEIEAHLALCPGCDIYLAQMRETIQALGRVPAQSLSDEAIAGLMAAFHYFHAPESPRR
jgi:anti-sigma factor RsiW